MTYCEWTKWTKCIPVRSSVYYVFSIVFLLCIVKNDCLEPLVADENGSSVEVYEHRDNSSLTESNKTLLAKNKSLRHTLGRWSYQIKNINIGKAESDSIVPVVTKDDSQFNLSFVNEAPVVKNGSRLRPRLHISPGYRESSRHGFLRLLDNDLVLKKNSQNQKHPSTAPTLAAAADFPTNLSSPQNDSANSASKHDREGNNHRSVEKGTPKNIVRNSKQEDEEIVLNITTTLESAALVASANARVELSTERFLSNDRLPRNTFGTTSQPKVVDTTLHEENNGSAKTAQDTDSPLSTSNIFYSTFKSSIVNKNSEELLYSSNKDEGKHREYSKAEPVHKYEMIILSKNGTVLNESETRSLITLHDTQISKNTTEVLTHKSNSSKTDETNYLVPEISCGDLNNNCTDNFMESASLSNTTNDNGNLSNIKMNSSINTSIATEIFIQLLKQNEILKILLLHLANQTRLESSLPLGNNRSERVLIDEQGNVEHEQHNFNQSSLENKSTEYTTDNHLILEQYSYSDEYLNESINKEISDYRGRGADGNASVLLTMTDNTTDFEHRQSNSFELIIESNISTTDSGNDTNFGVYGIPQPVEVYTDSEYVNGYNHSSELASPVRKCCGPAQYFSLETQSCTETNIQTDFRELVEELILGDDESEFVLIPGRIQVCPGTDQPPRIQVGISNYTHLLDQGFLYDIETDVHYDQELYCLELVGYDPEYSNLTAAYCPQELHSISVSSIRKCCPLDYYYDAVLIQCTPKQPGMKTIEDLVHDFSGNFNESMSIKTGKLTCENGSPELVDSSKVYLSIGDQLCVSQTGRCYPSTLYCIEYLWSSETYVEQPSAVYCPLDSFQKCCPPEQILQNDSCVNSDKFLSPFITQLMATLNSQIGFPANNEEICVHLLLDAHDDIRWWITNSGYLAIDSLKDQIQTKNYCVDDSLEPSNEVITMAYVCSNELKESIVLPLSVFDEGTIGKCCPPEKHLSPEHLDCVSGSSANKIDSDPLIQNASIARLGYTGFPHCTQYLMYPFSKATEDHVEFGQDSQLYAVSLDGQCIERETAIDPAYFCIDYGWIDGEPEVPSAIVCAPEWESVRLHTEKYNLTAALLGVSCFSLLIALVSLVYMRVRRGLVTIRKVNTLAGRILISYVLAHFVGFLTLAVSMHIDVVDNTISCLVIASVMQFFLLAGFHWNTSICLESLLLTLRVSTPEGRRFIYHSIWAWGLPAIITSFAIIMDTFRDSLPCGTITPKIGRTKCFFSDADAALLYFYLPIALTLSANFVLLISSKRARLNKLKRLELGQGKQSKSGVSVKKDSKGRPSMKGSHSSEHSGMRTHQARNLWSDSIRLVLWSGGTWLFEVIGFVAARYISPPRERWYDYLWYIPASINSLRGFGIFFILVMTEETRKKILRAMGTFRNKSTALWVSDRSKTARKVSATDKNTRHNMSMSVIQSEYPTRNLDKQRNHSVVTTMTNLSSVRNDRCYSCMTNRSSVQNGGNNDSARSHPILVHSISQTERRPSTTSSVGSFLDVEDVESVDVGRRRKLSAAPVFLPSVDEEDDYLDGTSSSVISPPKSSPTDSVFTHGPSAE